MSNDQENHLSMFKKVRDLLNEEDAIVSEVPAFKRAAVQLDANIKRIEDLSSGKVTLSEGDAEVKADKKARLARVMYLISSAMYTHALENNMLDLKKAAEYSEAELRHMPEESLLSVCKAQITLAKGNEATYADHGLTSDEVSDAEAKQAEYNAAISKKGSDVSQGIASTKSLADVISETNELITKRCDNHANRMIEKHADFVNRYQAARRIIDLGGSHESNDNAPDSPTPPAA